jgi:transcriptional regulator with XRE-family HTH domain
MEQEEKDERAKTLAQMFGKRIDEEDIARYREEIEKVFDPLPPPWTWRRLRQAANMTLRQMAEITGIKVNTIGRWETGQGTQNTDTWVFYAEQLARVVTEAFQADGSESGKFTQVPQPDSPAVISIQGQLRAAADTLEIWASQSASPQTRKDALIMLDHIADVQQKLRNAESVLRRIAGVTVNRKRKEQASG